MEGELGEAANSVIQSKHQDQHLIVAASYLKLSPLKSVAALENTAVIARHVRH